MAVAVARHQADDADALRRLGADVERAIAMAGADGDMAIISHGGAGTLLRCHLQGVPISRIEDQPVGGGGNGFSFDVASRQLLTGWRRMDQQPESGDILPHLALWKNLRRTSHAGIARCRQIYR